MSAGPLLISTSDIAELADERLPVISTWRNRFKKGDNAFPSPAGGTPARPLFEFDAVSDWVSRNRPEKNLQERLLPVKIWSAIRSLTTAGVEQFELVYWLHLTLARRKTELTPGENGLVLPSPDSVLHEAARGEVSDTVTRLIADAGTEELIAISDFALARLSAGYGRAGGDIGAVGSNISGILARAASAHVASTTGEAVIYDPSCGIGETIIQIAEDYMRSGRRVRVLGTEINQRVAAIATVRLQLRDIPAEIAAADSLSTQQFTDQLADLVVAEPPLGVSWTGMWPDSARSRFGIPPLRNADLAWVVDAVARLRAGGRGLVLTSVDALSRGGAEERVRAALVKSGAVETVIALPPNLLQYSGVALALWVLRAPSDNPQHQSVHVIDASDPDMPEPRAGAAKRADWIEQRVAGWMRSPSDLDELRGVTIAVAFLDELLEAGMDLTPTRWVKALAGAKLLQDMGELSNIFTGDIDDFRPEFIGFDGLPTARHMITVREMTESPESREAKLLRGQSIPNDEVSADTITSRDVSVGRLRPVGEFGAEPGFRTEAGDIVFTTMHRIRAVLDVDGGHRLGNGVYALRLDPDSRFDPAFVALCLASSWNERHQKGATIKHAKPGDLEIPLLPLEVQRDWLNAFNSLANVRAKAQNLVEAADELKDAAFNALRYGHQEDE
jgi:type I restriction-modification system DNA methylase subunit